VPVWPSWTSVVGLGLSRILNARLPGTEITGRSSNNAVKNVMLSERGPSVDGRGHWAFIAQLEKLGESRRSRNLSSVF
jgi:hypothetical protein